MDLQDPNELGSFTLGEPILVCRWRIAGGKLPLANRHLRALKARSQAEPLVSDALVSWAKQHIEQTLETGSAEHPDGVLMLVVDEQGHAAMTVGPYAAPRYRSSGKLALRAQDGRDQAEMTGIAPELLWGVRDGSLICGAEPGERLSGAASFVADLARTLGVQVRYDARLHIGALAGDSGADELFLTSDEHGILIATDLDGRICEGYRASYEELLRKSR